MSPAGAIARNEFRHLRRSPAMLVFMVLLPLAMMTIVRGANRLVLVAEGVDGASGTEQSVAGLTVMFVLFGAGTVGWMIFREHQWRTWDRLRASPATAVDIIVGKAAPNLVVIVAQQSILFVLGVVLFGLTIRGSVIGIVAMMVAVACVVIAFGIAVTSLVGRWDTMNQITNLGAVAMAGIGGAFMPLATLPVWIQSIAPLVPTYWAMRGYNALLLDGAGIVEIAPSAGALIAFAVGLAALAAARFRLDQPKAV